MNKKETSNRLFFDLNTKIGCNNKNTIFFLIINGVPKVTQDGENKVSLISLSPQKSLSKVKIQTTTNDKIILLRRIIDGNYVWTQENFNQLTNILKTLSKTKKDRDDNMSFGKLCDIVNSKQEFQIFKNEKFETIMIDVRIGVDYIIASSPISRILNYGGRGFHGGRA